MTLRPIKFSPCCISWFFSLFIFFLSFCYTFSRHISFRPSASSLHYMLLKVIKGKVFFPCYQQLNFLAKIDILKFIAIFLIIEAKPFSTFFCQQIFKTSHPILSRVLKFSTQAKDNFYRIFLAIAKIFFVVKI